jgi:hypothetical protein
MLAADASHITLLMKSELCRSVYTSSPGCAFSSAREWTRARDRGTGTARTRGSRMS